MTTIDKPACCNDKFFYNEQFKTKAFNHSHNCSELQFVITFFF